MILTREEALKYHKQMWEDMRGELGENPNINERTIFKHDWLKKHFPGEKVRCACFLCEYATNESGGDCDKCLIDWGYNKEMKSSGCEYGLNKWSKITISELLALPERKVGDEDECD